MTNGAGQRGHGASGMRGGQNPLSPLLPNTELQRERSSAALWRSARLTANIVAARDNATVCVACAARTPPIETNVEGAPPHTE
ncbi:unnamed protein product [Lampetra planeri]